MELYGAEVGSAPLRAEERTVFLNGSEDSKTPEGGEERPRHDRRLLIALQKERYRHVVPGGMGSKRDVSVFDGHQRFHHITCGRQRMSMILLQKCSSTRGHIP